MDIEGLGDKLVDHLVESGLVRTYGDLYRLERDDVIQLERMGDKSADKLLAAIAASKPRGLARLLNALSIRHVGRRVAAVLAEQYPAIQQLQKASVEELSDVHEVGETIAQSVHSFLTSEHGDKIVTDLTTVGVTMEEEQSARAVNDPRLTGKTFVVSGTLTKYTRDEIHALIAQHGARAASSVSKKTDYLVAGEKAGSKLAKAEKLGVEVLSEAAFEKLMGG